VYYRNIKKEKRKKEKKKRTGLFGTPW
jgi:hypothetical protein